MPGISIFIVLPSVVFYLVEGNWTYIDSVYYTFGSLATIGFGDFVNSHHGYVVEGKVGKWVWAYRGFTMLWLVFGLSFIFMIHSLVVDEIKASKIFPRVIRRSLRRLRRLQSETTTTTTTKITEEVITCNNDLRLQSDISMKVVKHHKSLTQIRRKSI